MLAVALVAVQVRRAEAHANVLERHALHVAARVHAKSRLSEAPVLLSPLNDWPAGAQQKKPISTGRALVSRRGRDVFVRAVIDRVRMAAVIVEDVLDEEVAGLGGGR